MGATGSKGVLSAAKSGDRRATLVALRDKLAAEIEDIDPRYLAPLVRQMTDVMNALDTMPAEARSKVDELAKRRAVRRATPKVADGAAGADVGRAGSS